MTKNCITKISNLRHFSYQCGSTQSWKRIWGFETSLVIRDHDHLSEWGWEKTSKEEGTSGYKSSLIRVIPECLLAKFILFHHMKTKTN